MIVGFSNLQMKEDLWCQWDAKIWKRAMAANRNVWNIGI